MAVEAWEAELQRITKADIDQLVREPSEDVRVQITDKICVGYLEDGVFNPNEKRLAQEIFRLLIRDASTRVRKAMAQHFRHSLDVPHDIIWALAEDEVAVAEHVLRFSPVLSEEDLIAVAQSAYEVGKLKAIAARIAVSQPLSHELIMAGHDEVTKTLLRNQGAAIAMESYYYLIEEYSEEGSLLEELVYRADLPHAVAEKLFAIVADHLKKQLTSDYHLPQQLVEEHVDAGREAALLDFLSPHMSNQDIQNLVISMHQNNRLDYTIILRSLCAGNVRFVETAMARLAGIPVSNARILLLDPGPLGFQAFYASTGLPEAFRDAVRVLFKIAQEVTEFGKYHREDYPQRMIERIMMDGYDKTVEHMPYLITIINQSARDAHAVH